MYSETRLNAPGHQKAGHNVRALTKCHTLLKGVNEARYMKLPVSGKP